MNSESMNVDRAVRTDDRPPRISTLEGPTSLPGADGAVAIELPLKPILTIESARGWTRLDLRDLWAHRDITNAATEYSVNVPSHGVVMLRVE